MTVKIVFMGAPAFAVPTLRALNEKFDVVGVITQPDKPTGRGRKMTSNPVKDEADRLEIPCIQPKDLYDSTVRINLEQWMPDVIVVVAFGKILPPWLLEFPKLGCINLHASILPKHRGASPISQAIVEGDETTGVSTMMMDEGLDTGDILLQVFFKIDDKDTTKSLGEKLMEPGAELVVRTISGMLDKTVSRVAQDQSKATNTTLLTKSDGKIDWNKSAIEIDRLIRAMNPWPVAFFELKGEPIKVWEAEPASGEGHSGQVISISKNGLKVGTRSGLLVLRQLQAPGKKKVMAFELASSKGIKVGDVLNS